MRFSRPNRGGRNPSEGKGIMTKKRLMAGAAALVVVAVGGYWLIQNNGSIEHLFILIAACMVSFGLLTAVSVWKVSWAR